MQIPDLLANDGHCFVVVVAENDPDGKLAYLTTILQIILHSSSLIAEESEKSVQEETSPDL